MTDNQTVEAPHTAIHLSVSDLTSFEWNRAQPVPLDHYWSGEPAPAGRLAEVRIVWSNEALHLRFDCRQSEPLVVNSSPQTEKKTMGLWDRDVCEIYIAPDPRMIERYYEIEAAPTGEWLDVAINWKPDTRESDWDFRSGMTTAARVDEDRVTIAMRIPWSLAIHRPQKNERWRINLFRCVGKDPDRGYLAWQPTRTPEPGFHVPQVFGWLVFS